MNYDKEIKNSTGTSPRAILKLSREIWLNYFNNTLYAKGLISETEMRKMRRMISK